MKRKQQHKDTKSKPKKRKFIKKPTYPGGSKALEAFIAQNLRYPEEALRNGVEGNVQVEYEVNEDGKVIRARVLRGIGYGCDEEALRLVRLLRYEGVRNRHIHVTTRFTLVIRFRLPRQTPAVRYEYRPASVSSEQSASVFSYKISV